MKKLFCLGSAIIVTSALFASQQQEPVPTVQLNGDALRMSGNAVVLRASSDVIPIQPQKPLKRSNSSSGSGNSSGSSPTGAEGLFPGQTGLGNRHLYNIAPIHVIETEWFRGK